MIITADHGNCELMRDPVDRARRTPPTRVNPVPLLYVNDRDKAAKIRSGGRICDVAPTMLKLMGLPQPQCHERRAALLRSEHSVDMSQENVDLIYDWNEVERRGRLIPKGVTFLDETLRDGLQNPSVVDPPVEAKIELLHLMHEIGIHGADIGLPGSSQRAFDDVVQDVQGHRSLEAQGQAGRAPGAPSSSDVTPMIEVSQRAGMPVEAFFSSAARPSASSPRNGTSTSSRAARPRRSTSR